MPNLFLAPVIGDKGKWYQKREQFVLFILAEFRITKPELGVFFFFFFGWTSKAFYSQYEFLDENTT